MPHQRLLIPALLAAISLPTLTHAAVIATTGAVVVVPAMDNVNNEAL